MKSAALGHQYLAVNTFNKNDYYFGTGRYRGGRKNHSDASPIIPPEEQLISSISTTDSLSARPSALLEEAGPSAVLFEQKVNDSTDAHVVYQHKIRNDTIDDEVDDQDEPHSLKSLLRKRYRNGNHTGKLSSRVRQFYRKQDQLIDSLEKLHGEDLNNAQSNDQKLDKQKRQTDLLIKATVILNCTLLVAKIVAAVLSRSLSIISSVVDSAVDSASACLLFWAIHAIKRRNPYKYPAGRTRLEPIIIVIFSVVMVSASVQIIFESSEVLIDYTEHFENNSTDLRRIDMGPVPITVMCVTIVCKAILSSLCFRISNPTMRAVAHDHLNDVFSNIVALVCGIIAAAALSGAIKKTEVVMIDPIGAILVSLYIIFCWGKQLREQVRNLTGYKAEPEFLQKITWLTLHHSPFIRQIDTVRAFHFGTSFLVEVEIILPETMSLKEAHDIGDSLKAKLEKVPEVELAFVHLDYTVDALQY